MTGILNQIKRRKAKGTRAAYDIHQKAVGFFLRDSEVVRPYMTLVAELGMQHLCVRLFARSVQRYWAFRQGGLRIRVGESRLPGQARAEGCGAVECRAENEAVLECGRRLLSLGKGAVSSADKDMAR